MIGFDTIEKEQNTNHTQVSLTCISKTNLIFFYGRCKVVHHALFCRSHRGLLHHFWIQGLTKSQGMCIFIAHSWHVECVCLLSKLHEAKHHVNAHLIWIDKMGNVVMKNAEHCLYREWLRRSTAKNKLEGCLFWFLKMCWHLFGSFLPVVAQACPDNVKMFLKSVV